MHQEIENIIKKNLPEKKENPKNKCINAENHLFGRCFSCEKNNGFNDCIDEINPSLIADEVLKVQRESIEELRKKSETDPNMTIARIFEELLTSLSPSTNKGGE